VKHVENVGECNGRVIMRYEAINVRKYDDKCETSKGTIRCKSVARRVVL
jgi:hypothetical protein